MIESKAWDWKNAEKEVWLKPSEESFYYAEKWRAEGRSRLLDLGCGLGRHSIFFDSRGFIVTAMDLSDYGIKHLREWKRKNGTDFRTVVGDMNKLPFADNAFDCIYSYHVISHTDTEGIRRVISEIRRVLKP
ncbi:MAG: class I SAM-dependent methyltransferase, partial [Ruminiclostridium sp.]|nr:class I SAM-dependent methyltransferase [Ruminiclostridium sp.]